MLQLKRSLPWRILRRESQRPPDGDWFVWLILAGRGWGKTRVGAEYIGQALTENAGWRAALVAQTFDDGRDVMVEGESGLLSVLPPSMLRGGSAESAWNRSMGQLFLSNGSRADIYSSEKPQTLRGPQHHVGWGDEPAYWKDAHRGDAENTTWSNLTLGIRLGEHPRIVLTTTPKRSALLLKQIRTRSNVVVTRGSTYENLDNLAPTFRADILGRYEGTALGRQELMAEDIEDVESALWRRAWIVYREPPSLYRAGLLTPDLVKVVVAVDPSITATGDEAGIVVAGRGANDMGYAMDDRSIQGSPKTWASRAVQAYRDHKADHIVAEANQGGEMVAETIHTVDPSVPVRLVHASRGKRTRAEPISAKYEQGRVFHVRPMPELEDELCTWDPLSGESPNRLDALVWAMTDLFPNTSWGSGEGEAALIA